MDPATLEEMKEQINAVLDAEAVLYKINYRVESMEQQGISIKAFCPIHQETMIRSLILDPNKRRFRCNYFNCPGNRGGTFLELYCLATGCSEEEGVQFWSGELGVGDDQVPLDDPSRVEGHEPEEDIPRFSPEETEPEAVEAEPAGVDEAEVALEDLVEFDTPVGSGKPVEESRVEADASDVSFAEGEGDFVAGPEEEEGESKDAPEYQRAYRGAVEAFESNRYNGALELFQQALGAAGGAQDQLDCEIMLARCYIHLKKSDEALSLLRGGLNRPEVPEVAQKEILYRTAEAWECGEQTEKAVEVLRVLTQKFGQYRDVENWLNRLQGRRKQAKAEPSDRRISFI